MTKEQLDLEILILRLWGAMIKKFLPKTRCEWRIKDIPNETEKD